MATPLPSPPRRRTATSTSPERRASHRSGVAPLPVIRTGPDRGGPVAPATPATPATAPAHQPTPAGPATAATPAGPAFGRPGGERLTPFDPTILAVRWSTTVVCVALAAGAFLAPDPTVIPWVLAVVANTAVRTRTPLRDDGSVHSTANLLLEVALPVLAVVATGHWTSPLVLLLVNAIVVAAFARGFAFALRVGTTSALAVSLPGLGQWTAADATSAAQWTTVLLAIAIVAGSARRLWGEASRQHRVDQERLDRLGDANAFLASLHRDEERTRIARDLHDRIGQSLAHLAFEVDRIVDRDRTGQPLTEDLAALRRDLRGVVGEVRDTLYDLRTDVTASTDLPAVVQGYADRVAERSGLTVSVDGSGQRRLPLRQERELWRIAQEAIANVERHAAARQVTVVWRCDRQGALLQISDDGRGFPDGAGRFDSYGIVGMRERAVSIGAALDIHSRPGEGTTVRCYLEHR